MNAVSVGVANVRVVWNGPHRNSVPGWPHLQESRYTAMRDYGLRKAVDMTDSGGDEPARRDEKESGGTDSLTRLLPILYAELRRLAGRYMRDERYGHTLQPTALVHEAYLKLAGQEKAGWRNRAHVMGVAGQIMRRILVDHARKRHAAKRSGPSTAALQDRCAASSGYAEPEQILAIDAALKRLGSLDPQQARVVELRYFVGLSAEEAARAMDISQRTVEREWTFAKAWLRAELCEGRQP
jgi:RNA polymerase sigma-70 factor, ECF subfamily